MEAHAETRRVAVPKIKLDSEDGSRVDAEDAAASLVAGASESSRAEEDYTQLPDVPFSSRLALVVTKALAGDLLRGRQLQPWEPKALNPLHVNMVLDRAAGMKPCEISEKYGLSLARGSIILNHPDAVQIYNAVLSTSADNLADPRKRIESYAHEVLDIKMELVRDAETPRMLRDKIATDILDRAGYGARKQLDVDVQHRVELPAAQASLLATALQESNRIADVDYSRFLLKSPTSEGGETPQATVPALRLPGGIGRAEGIRAFAEDATSKATATPSEDGPAAIGPWPIDVYDQSAADGTSDTEHDRLSADTENGDSGSATFSPRERVA